MTKLLRRFACLLCTVALLAGLGGCAPSGSDIKIGVSFGVGPAARWPMEETYMKERAEELGITLETRFNTTDTPKTQQEECFELIDSGIQVLILIPRDVNKTAEILSYAKKKNVKVISYARVILGEQVDLFVGYDSGRIGQIMGRYLTELVFQGDYIILRGDPNDNNATLLYDGAMKHIKPLEGNINILMDEALPGWDPATAKELVKQAVAANGNHVDAILAPNDKVAGACAEALSELGVTDQVYITGMDAELDAIQRIVTGTQSMTMYMNLQELAHTAVNEAYNMATGKAVNVNANFDNQSGGAGIDANLITGEQVVKENLDRVLIDSGHYTHAEIYGS